MFKSSVSSPFQEKLFFLTILFFLFSAFASDAKAASNCIGFQGWYAPSTPNATHPDFGSYVYVISNYNTNTLCDGYATKNANTGTWEQFPTCKPSDGHSTKVTTSDDIYGNSQSITTEAAGFSSDLESEATMMQLGANLGGIANTTKQQQTYKCFNPGADPTETFDIDFELCFEYQTNAVGTVVTYPDDGKVNVTSGQSGSGSISWDTSNEIKRKEGTTVIDNLCKEGHLTIAGDEGDFYFSMNSILKGTKYKASGSTQWRRSGRMLTSFELLTPASGSGVWCDKKTGEEEEPPPSSKEPDECSWFQKLTCQCSANKTPDPIDFVNGFKTLTEVDYDGIGPLMLGRVYRSNGTWLDYNFGKFWRHNYDRTLTITTTSLATTARIVNQGGVITIFRKGNNGDWLPYDFDVVSTFEEVTSGSTVVGYLYTLPDNTKEYYDTGGKLTRIEYLGSQAVNLTYDGSGRLDEVEDEGGRKLEFNYDGSDRVSSVVTPDGTYSYTYGSNNNLTQVTKPDTKTRQYHYEDTSYANALTGLTNENGVRFLTWAYDSQGRPVSSERAGSTGAYAVSYDSDTQVTVTNPLGKDTVYTIGEVANRRVITQIDGLVSLHCPASQALMSYDAKAFLNEVTDWKGNVTQATYDDRGLITEIKEGVGTPEERTTTATWDSSFRLVDEVSVDDLEIDYSYDTYGRPTSVTATDTNTSETRTWTLTYYSNTTDGSGNSILGRLKDVDGPRTDVTDKTTFTYDTKFNLTKITNALSQEVNITARDAAGRPTTIEDPNGVETDLTYDTNGWLETITSAPGTSLEAETTLTYSDAGDITQMDLPNGTTLSYTYDNARRLTEIEDDLGNTIVFTLNDAGNVTKEERKDTGSTLKFQYTQTFDEMARIIKHTGAGAQEWEFEYDKNSDLTKFTDANNNETTYAFDALQRLVSSTDAISGTTDLSINQLDQTTQVEDPRTNDTDYTYNAFGDVTQIVSPDTGTTSFTYDKAGNVTSMTDARSVVTNYTYDAINRLTEIEYPSDSSLDVTFTYDDNPTPGACGTSEGRLCRTVDASGTTDYMYNDLGQLIEVKEVRGALTFTTEYEYDLAGLVTKITLPSGREVDYTRNGNGQTTQVDTTVNSTATTVVSSLSYLPFGPVTGMSYGNGLALSASFDQDYRMTSRSVNTVFSHSYSYDDNGNVTQKGGHSYDYDAMNRVVEEVFGMDTTEWTYDAIGNRLTETVNSTATTYTYPSGNSKLSSVGGTSYSYDAMGNVTAKGAQGFVYNAAAQMEEATLSAVTVGEYVYNAYNQRTSKTVSGVTTHYVYGPGGMLYGEYDSSGNLIREYIYANGAPVAQIDAGSPESILYLHTDHLLTPRYATDSTGATVWSWDSGAFGAEAPTGSATVNLRFPGQYYDAETGLHYNWHRYYDPETGRYITSDPLGLAAGLNTYSYAAQNPLSYIDPDGQLAIAVLWPILGHILTWGGGSFIGGVIYADLIDAVQCDITWNQFWRNTAWNVVTGAIGYGVGKALGWLGRSRFLGGLYGNIKGKIPGNEAHHMPADSVSPIPKSQGPAVSVPPPIHKQTQSWGNSKAAQRWRQRQKELIEQGKFEEAQQMDIDDLREICKNTPGCRMKDIDKAIEDMKKANPQDIKL